MRFGGVLVVAGALVCAPAGQAAAEMPNYDAEAHCKRMANYSGTPSQSLLNGCLRLEQTAYDELKPAWDALPAATRAHCDRLAKVRGGSYSLLQGCVRLEQDAQKDNEQFKFKR
jgi:hypothetical protein